MRDIVLVFAFFLFQGIDFSNGRSYTELDINQDLRERGSTYSVTQPKMFEGDIVDNDRLQLLIEDKAYEARTGVTPFDAGTFGKWPNGVVPYTFERGFTDSYKIVVKKAISEYHKHTCIRWIPRTTQRDYVTFFHGSGCYSYIGHQGQPDQRISLGQGCTLVGIALHEMMHCLGIFHEQSRIDRDKHIKIIWNNINTKYENNFKKYLPGQASTLGEPYDKKSVMHYSNYAFSRNNKKTIISVLDENETFGQRERLSQIDIKQLNKHYGCGAAKKATTSNCKDRYVFCTDLRKGWCRHRWVIRNCQKSCHRCPSVKTETLTTVPARVTRATISSQSQCKDIIMGCQGWVKAGNCEKDDYMKYLSLNCKKSCGKCETEETTVATPARVTRAIISSQSQCKDISEGCPRWVKAGYCEKDDYMEYLSLNCKKSCGKCGAEETTVATPARVTRATISSQSQCKDIIMECPRWVKAGYCEKDDYVKYLSLNCKKSCGKCEAEETTVATPARVTRATISSQSQCKDISEGCPGWVKAGYCEKDDYMKYLSLNCKKSCGKCEAEETTVATTAGTTAKATIKSECKDIKTGCSGWAKNGLCTNTKNDYNIYMLNNCPKSCKKCQEETNTETPSTAEAPPTTEAPTTTKAATISSSCVDERDECPAWKADGYCQSTDDRNRGFMEGKCRKSCNIC